MLSPREQQQAWWHWLKTPAAVSLACLAATLLIAAQAFRSHPAPKKEVTQTPAASIESYGMDNALGKRTSQIASLVDTGQSTEALGKAGQSKDKLPEHGKDIPWGQQEAHRAAPRGNASALHGNTTARLWVHSGLEVLIINDTSAGLSPKGVLLVFHGCSHSALDWWHASPGCLRCSGLPEELAITKAALKRNLVVIAFSSLDREQHHCWDTAYPPEKSADVLAVIKAWQRLVELENWGRIPHYALGGSSGGAFALLLAQRVRLSGVCSIIMPAQPHTLDVKPHTIDLSQTWDFPPTFFIAMERDELTAEAVGSNIAELKKQGVSVANVTVAPRPLNAFFFAARIEGVTNETSLAMYNALLAEGCINATGYLIDNPRSMVMMRKWQKALRERVPAMKSMNLNKDESPVFEELNLAWASHELVSDYTDAVLDWFEARQDGPKLMTAVNPRH